MIVLPEPPRLVPPTATVRLSYLSASRTDTDDFAAFVASCRGVRHRWGVPFSTFWYVSGEHYLGSVTIRHELTPELLADGGHIGYYVSPAWRRQGHATRMLGAALPEARRLGLSEVLLTCAPGNEASRRVVLANGGVPAETLGADLRFWIRLP